MDGWMDGLIDGCRYHLDLLNEPNKPATPGGQSIDQSINQSRNQSIIQSTNLSTPTTTTTPTPQPATATALRLCGPGRGGNARPSVDAAQVGRGFEWEEVVTGWGTAREGQGKR